MADLRSRVADHIGRHFHQVSDHAANGCSYDPTGVRGDICDCGHRGRIAADALTPLLEVARAARRIADTPTPFGAYERWRQSGDTSDADELSQWDYYVKDLMDALARLDALGEDAA